MNADNSDGRTLVSYLSGLLSGGGLGALLIVFGFKYDWFHSGDLTSVMIAGALTVAAGALLPELRARRSRPQASSAA
jgi:Na+-transporting NADH:ubiquinone oxidoreductase subunit NqrD